MKSRRTMLSPSPLLRWALRRARAGETDTKTVLIIIFSVIGGLVLLVCGGLVLLILPAVQQARNQGRIDRKIDDRKICCTIFLSSIFLSALS